MGSHHRPTAGQCSLVQPPRLITCLLLLLLLLLLSSPLTLPCSASSAVITHLPGFHGRLPFYLETGYIGVEEKTGTELFYYFVESERNPDTDPLVLWLVGGPRCSGFCGVVYEEGPLNFLLETYNGSSPRLVYNQYSWTQMASIIFLDSPVGSGFSYARDPNGYDVGDISSSLQVVTFMKEGYIVGNPITGSKFDKNFHVPYSHGVGIISDQLYEAAVTHCKGHFVNPTNQLCANVLSTIHKLMSEVSDGNILEDKCVKAAPKPTIDVSASRALLEEYNQLHKPPIRPSIDCLSYRYYLSYCWMNDNTTRDALKIKKGTIDEWLRCNKGVLPYAQDIPSSLNYHFNLTTRGYRALVMSGDHDLILPFLSTQAWIGSFNFFIANDWRAWHVDGQAAGFTIEYANNLTFATVKGGSHVVTTNKPKESFAMGKRRLANKPL
ncbi:serine carboxypeptidase-like 18 [Oryza sativa Japonica Group]|uniref:serine carboxypeptidase-like 18 n=1 Tax=Oryza sativa subsp. japonica TaxID=39947 RepID=UPI00339C4C30